jgi:23S rRNA (guanosine2251-2'-O)-methyltransferase
LSKTEIIYGHNPVLEAIRAGKEIEKLFILSTMQPARASEIKKAALEFNIPFQFVPKEKLNRVTRQNHQGVVAVITLIPYTEIESLLPGIYEAGQNPFILMLDKITDVRNLGSIARTAECAGIQALVVPSRGAAMVNADAIKTSAGALNNIPLSRVGNFQETIKFLKNSGLQIIGATEKASKPYYLADFKKPTAILLGSEEKGIAEENLRLCDDLINIPMTGGVGSLNVSVAAGIILFEGVKQRSKHV